MCATLQNVAERRWLWRDRHTDFFRRPSISMATKTVHSAFITEMKTRFGEIILLILKMILETWLATGELFLLANLAGRHSIASAISGGPKLVGSILKILLSSEWVGLSESRPNPFRSPTSGSLVMLPESTLCFEN